MTLYCKANYLYVSENTLSKIRISGIEIHEKLVYICCMAYRTKPAIKIPQTTNLKFNFIFLLN